MITEAAPAKLNLALHVRSRRPDGYHSLETLFAFVADGDRVTVAPALSDHFAVVGPFAAALTHEGDNLVVRAARGFADATGIAGRYAITLDKHLPVASGIGGGSADAAAALRALARLNGVAPDDVRLFALAATLGADVPACLLGQSAIGRDKGEALEPLPGLAGTPVLLVNPGVAVSTAQVFARWDGIDHGPLPCGDAALIARSGRNDLEAPARSLAPVIGEVLDLLRAQVGTTLARMSGSGATCFALFEDGRARDGAAQAIREARPQWWCLETVLT